MSIKQPDVSEKQLREQLARDTDKAKAFDAGFQQALKQEDYIDYRHGQKWVVAQVRQRFQNLVILAFDGYSPEVTEVGSVEDHVAERGRPAVQTAHPGVHRARAVRGPQVLAAESGERPRERWLTR